MRVPLVLALLLLLAACSGGSPAPTTSRAPAVSTTSTVAAVTTTTAPSSAAPGVLALASGRGDDGSLEVAVWLDGDPTVAGAVVVVGIDSDDSYPGVGQVRPHLEGSVLLTSDGSGFDATVSSEGEVVADHTTAADWVFWAYDGEVLRLFFVQDVALRAGTVWVDVAVGADASPLGTAGVPLGDACSYHGSGAEVDEPTGGVPDPGRTCRYL